MSFQRVGKTTMRLLQQCKRKLIITTFQCCLFLKIFLKQQEHHIIINDNPQIARDGIIISFIVVKVFALMKRVKVLISAKDKTIQLTVLCPL